MTAAAKPESYLASPVDRLLTERCALGDEKAWVTLHRQYYPVAVGFLRKLGVRPEDLEDTTQEVFLQVFRYLGRFREEAELRTWLYQLCITQARRARQGYRVVQVLKRMLALAPVESLVSHPGFSEQAARGRIDAALAQLSDSERAVFVLYEMEGLPGKEIAAIVKAKEATVWRRLHYARRTFRQALGFDPEEIEA